jgi:hypothetical protein
MRGFEMASSERRIEKHRAQKFCCQKETKKLADAIDEREIGEIPS